MGYRRAANLDKDLIFAEYFNSEQEARRNGCIPTSVTFDNGIASFNGSTSIIQRDILLPLPISIRIRLKGNSTITANKRGVMGHTLSTAGYGALTFDGSTFGMYNTSGTARSFSASYSKETWYDAIFTMVSGSQKLYVNGVVDGTTYTDSLTNTYNLKCIGNLDSDKSIDRPFDGDIELIEIYNKVLSAEEVVNLYNDTRYSIPNLDKILHVTAKDGVVRNLLSGNDLSGDLYGAGIANAATVGGDTDVTTGFTSVGLDGTGANVFESQSSITNRSGFALHISSEDTPTADARVYMDLEAAPFSLVDGDEVEVSLDVRHEGIALSNNWRWGLGATNNDNAGESKAIPVTQTSFIRQSVTYTHDNNHRYLVISEASGANDGGLYIDNIIIRKVVPEVISTDIAVFKDGDIHVPLFNGTTSQINCGDYNILVGDITIIGWINRFGLGAASEGNIFSNGDIRIYVSSSGRIYAYRGALPAFSNAAFPGLHEWVFVTCVMKADGSVITYINTVDETSDGSSDIPATGGDMIVGNRAGIREFDGLIDDLQVISGIMTASEISQYYTATKHKYNK